MASLKSISSKKKKVEHKPVPQRKSNAARVLEEKHIGVETTNWVDVPSDLVDMKVYTNLRIYNYFYDHKDAFKWAEEWVKKNRGQDLNDFKASEEWRVNTTLGGLCKMHMAGAPLDEKRILWINAGINAAVNAGKANRAKEVTASNKPVKTSADILAEKIHDFIAEVEGVVDSYIKQSASTDEVYSVYNELKKVNAPKPLAQKVYDYYKPLYDEIEELITKKTPDLVEGYKHLKSAKDKKDYLTFIKGILDDCQKFMNAATAAKVRAPRQPRAKKKVPIEKIVAKVKYQKESAEYKLTSVDPANLVGASEVYLFNTKYRHLIQLVAASADGFGIKGTTITNLREESCLRKTLRKPEDVLTEIGKTTKARVNRVFSDIKTKSAPANGRINEETIILKVFK